MKKNITASLVPQNYLNIIIFYLLDFFHLYFLHISYSLTFLFFIDDIQETSRAHVICILSEMYSYHKELYNRFHDQLVCLNHVLSAYRFSAYTNMLRFDKCILCICLGYSHLVVSSLANLVKDYAH